MLSGRRYNEEGMEERIFVDQYMPLDIDALTITREISDILGITSTLPFAKPWMLLPFASWDDELNMSVKVKVERTVRRFFS